VIRVFLADDHLFMRDALVLLLNAERGMRVVGVAGDPVETLRNLAGTDCDVCLLNLSMAPMNPLSPVNPLSPLSPLNRATSFLPVVASVAARPGVLPAPMAPMGQGGGVQLLGQVRQAFPQLPVLVLGSDSGKVVALRCIRAGARGYLAKTRTVTQLLEAIRELAAGRMAMEPSLTQELALNMLSPEQRDPHARLSAREMQIFLRLIGGSAVGRIAEEFQLSVKTVSTHKIRIQKKLDCNGIAALVHYGQRHGLLEQISNSR